MNFQGAARRTGKQSKRPKEVPKEFPNFWTRPLFLKNPGSSLEKTSIRRVIILVGYNGQYLTNMHLFGQGL